MKNKTKNNDKRNYLQEMKHTQYQQIVLDAKTICVTI